MSDAKTPWGGRFERSPAAFLAEFGNSLPVDKRLWAEDIRGSIAHARMLAKAGRDHRGGRRRHRGGALGQIYREIGAGTFVWDLADEDVHMAIERVLTERIGPAGARLHTGRSRNDQVAHRHAAVRQGARAPTSVDRRARRCAGSLLRLAEEHLGVVMPGYTHLQKAQPVLLSHHLLAYVVDAHARLHPLASRARGRRRAAARQRGARRHDVPARPRVRGRAARLLGGERELDGRGHRPRLPARPHLRVRGLPDASLAPRRGAHPVVERRVRLRHDGRRVLDRLVDHAAEEEPRLRRARARQDRARLRRPAVAARDAQGAAARLQQGHAGGQGAGVRRDRHARALAARDGRHARTRCTSTPTACATAPRAASWPRPTSPTTSSARACRSARRTRSSAASCSRASATGVTLQDLTAEQFAAHAEQFGPDVLDAVDIERSWRGASPPAATGHDAVSVQLSQVRDALAADQAWLESLAE